jgi:hypothetical protein
MQLYFTILVALCFVFPLFFILFLFVELVPLPKKDAFMYKKNASCFPGEFNIDKDWIPIFEHHNSNK